jgi:hypothetical protein
MTTFSIKDLEKMKATAQREHQLRKKVYPRWVEQGRMIQQFADDEIIQQAKIVALIQEVIEEKTGAQRLFP